MGNGVIGVPTQNVQLVVMEEHIPELDNVIIQYLLVVECTVMVHQMKLHLAILTNAHVSYTVIHCV